MNLEIKKSGIEQHFFHEFLSSKFKNLQHFKLLKAEVIQYVQAAKTLRICL